MGNFSLKSKGTVAVLHFFLSEQIMSKVGSIIYNTFTQGAWKLKCIKLIIKKIGAGGWGRTLAIIQAPPYFMISIKVFEICADRLTSAKKRLFGQELAQIVEWVHQVNTFCNSAIKWDSFETWGHCNWFSKLANWQIGLKAWALHYFISNCIDHTFKIFFFFTKLHIS